MNDRHGTGRTTRMLNRAIALAREGRAVYVLVDSEQEARRLWREIPDELGIKVEFADNPAFDWHLMQIRGAHPNCITLVDHYAIERRFKRLLEELHRYDAEEER